VHRSCAPPHYVRGDAELPRRTRLGLAADAEVSVAGALRQPCAVSDELTAEYKERYPAKLGSGQCLRTRVNLPAPATLQRIDGKPIGTTALGP
jgi:hypothetical protein